MRAARIHGWNQSPVVDEVPEPQRGPGQTLVQLQAAAVTHLDLTVRTGEFALVPPLPYVPGCEGAGVVVESDTLEPGTQVLFRDGSVGLDTDGTWQERIVVPDGDLVPLGMTVDPVIATTFFTAATTAAVTLFDIARIQPGETLLVAGAAGAIGSVIAQLALEAGAEVIGLVSRASRLADLPAGVTGVALDDEAATAELAETRRVDLLIDTVGGPGLADRIGWVRTGGRAAILGYTAGTELVIDLPNWFFSTVTLIPVNLMLFEEESARYAAELLPRFASGELTVAVEEITLDGVADAIARLAAGEATGRPVILF